MSTIANFRSGVCKLERPGDFRSGVLCHDHTGGAAGDAVSLNREIGQTAAVSHKVRGADCAGDFQRGCGGYVACTTEVDTGPTRSEDATAYMQRLTGVGGADADLAAAFD